MNFNYFIAIFLSLLTSLFADLPAVSSSTIGWFSRKDPTLEGIKWGNWGSRPYEYKWVSAVVSVEGKKVIDLGVGLPSQYNWFNYVVNALHPSFYAGIDWDARIIEEQIVQSNFEIRHMSMANLSYPDREFDVAYCISTFEHIPHDLFMKSIQEAHRVLKDDGVLIITLDERWDANLPYTPHNNWNDLEQSLVAKGMFHPRGHSSFGLREFLVLVADYFVPYDEEINPADWSKNNRDPRLLNSGDLYNSCVSYAVLKKNLKIDRN